MSGMRQPQRRFQHAHQRAAAPALLQLGCRRLVACASCTLANSKYQSQYSFQTKP